MRNKLNVLFICGWYPSRVLTNNGDFIQRHAEAVSLKQNVSVLHIITDKNCTKNIEFTSKKTNGIQTHIAYVKKTNSRVVKLIQFCRAYLILLKKVKPFDVVHLHELYPFGLFALHLKWLQKKPFLISEHWSGYLTPKLKNRTFFQKIILNLITKNASFICPVTQNLADSMEHFGLKGNYFPVPNVVDTKLFLPKKKEENEFTIIHISNMVPLKNVPQMLQVAKKLEIEIGAFTWKFIGEKIDGFSSLIKDLQFKTANIHFINHIAHKELVKEIQNANVLVLFSDYESLPCVILEAFSCGIPVISTDVGGIKEYFPHNFGFLIEIGNKKELLEKIKQTQQQKLATSKEMHAYAKSNFSKEAIATIFSDLYNKALKIKY